MKPLIRSKAIRAKCMDCCGSQQGEIKLCPVIECPLWPWRMGKQPSAEDLKTLENYEHNQEYQNPKKVVKNAPQKQK